MAEQVRRALAWVYRNAASFGGDPDRIYISGHSSGSHLAGVRADDRLEGGGPAPDIFKGAVLLQRHVRLKPVRLSKRSRYVKFTDEMEEKLSAQRHLDGLHTPLILAYGTCETPEFQRQTRDFAAAVRRLQAGAAPRRRGLQPFRAAGDAGNPYGLVGRAVLEQMGLA